MYSADDLKWTSVREFRAVGTGKFRTTRNGNRKEELIGREFVRTAGAGVLELDEWYRLMEEAVRREGKEALLERIVERCRRGCFRDEKKLRQYALECLSDEAYKVWIQRGEMTE